MLSTFDLISLHNARARPSLWISLVNDSFMYHITPASTLMHGSTTNVTIADEHPSPHPPDWIVYLELFPRADTTSFPLYPSSLLFCLLVICPPKHVDFIRPIDSLSRQTVPFVHTHAHTTTPYPHPSMQ